RTVDSTLAFTGVTGDTAATTQILVNASGGARASMRVGRSIRGRRKKRSRVRNSQNPAPRRCRREMAERKKPDAVVAAARNYNWVRERGKAQPYPCRHSSAEQFQTRMRTRPTPSRNVSFP